MTLGCLWPLKPLCLSMVMMVLWGLITPQLLNKVMLLLVKDLELLQAGKLDVSGIHKLAKMGSSGHHSQHIWRDFVQLLPKPKLPKLQMVMFPLKHTNLGRFSKALPLLLPHTLFAAIYNHYPVMWQRIVYPGALTCQRFWRAVSGSPQFAEHDVK